MLHGQFVRWWFNPENQPLIANCSCFDYVFFRFVSLHSRLQHAATQPNRHSLAAFLLLDVPHVS